MLAHSEAMRILILEDCMVCRGRRDRREVGGGYLLRLSSLRAATGYVDRKLKGKFCVMYRVRRNIIPGGGG